MGYLIRLSRSFKSIATLKLLFTTLVRPKLEYADVIWPPRKEKNVNAIEYCQRRFAKFLEFKSTRTYPPRGLDHIVFCDKFAMPSLENRRSIHEIIYILKIVHNIVDSPVLLAQIPLSIPRFNARNPSTFYLRPTHNRFIINSRLNVMLNKTNNFLSAKRDVDIFVNSIAHLCKCATNYVNSTTSS